MKTIIEEIREYIACPQFGDDHYGKWGALSKIQRAKIKELCDYASDLEEIVDKYMRDNFEEFDVTIFINEEDNMEGYKERMIKEYKELKERYEKLHKMLVKAEAATLDFELGCPLNLLVQQAKAMAEYLHVLEIRAEIEKVNINE